MTNFLYQSATIELKAEHNALVLQGHPDFYVAKTLALAGSQWLKNCQLSQIDFHVYHMEIHNSAVLGILLEWLRTAQQQHIKIGVINLPRSMQELVDLFDLTPVFEQLAQIQFIARDQLNPQ